MEVEYKGEIIIVDEESYLRYLIENDNSYLNKFYQNIIKAKKFKLKEDAEDLGYELVAIDSTSSVVIDD